MVPGESPRWWFLRFCYVYEICYLRSLTAIRAATVILSEVEGSVKN